MLAQETLQAVCPLGTPAPKQPWITVFSWAEIRVHSIARQVFLGRASGRRRRRSRGRSSKFGGVCQNVTRRNAIAEARLETARLGRLLRPLARSARRAVGQDKAEWREGRPGSGRRRLQVPLVRFSILSDSSVVPRKRGDRNQVRSLQWKTGLLC